MREGLVGTAVPRGATMTTEARDVWIGCLVYVLRHRPRLSAAGMAPLCPPLGTLERALEDDCWRPTGVVEDRYGDTCRTRATAVLLCVDQSAPPSVCAQARTWVGMRARHLPMQLVRLLSPAGATTEPATNTDSPRPAHLFEGDLEHWEEDEPEEDGPEPRSHEDEEW